VNLLSPEGGEGERRRREGRVREKGKRSGERKAERSQ